MTEAAERCGHCDTVLPPTSFSPTYCTPQCQDAWHQTCADIMPSAVEIPVDAAAKAAWDRQWRSDLTRRVEHTDRELAHLRERERARARARREADEAAEQTLSRCSERVYSPAASIPALTISRWALRLRSTREARWWSIRS